MHRQKFVSATLIALCATTFTNRAHAAVVDVTTGGFDFRIYVPDTPTVRGVVASFNGAGADFRSEADAAVNQAVVKAWRFAFVGTRAFSGNNGAALATALTDAMARAGAATKHPELKNAPWLLTGHSNGGRAACAIVASAPDRVIGFVPMRGATAQTLSAEARKVPGLYLVAPTDSNAGNFKAFTQARAAGAPVGFGVETLANHVPVPQERGNSWVLIWTYFGELIRLRYPADRAPTADAIPQLDALVETSGWLTTHPTIGATNAVEGAVAFPEAEPYANYSGDKAAASWLPSRVAAYHLRAYNARDKVSTTEPRNLAIKFVSPTTTVGRAIDVRSGGKMDLEIDPRTLTDITKIEFFVGNQALATLKRAPWKIQMTDVPAGIHGVNVVATTNTGLHAGFETYLMSGNATFGTSEGTAINLPDDGATGGGGSGGGGSGGGSGGVGGGGVGGGGAGGTAQAGSSGTAGAGSEDTAGESGTDPVAGENGSTGGTAGGASTSDDKGGGCAIAARGTDAGPVWILAVVGTILLRRRRRRQRP